MANKSPGKPKAKPEKLSRLGKRTGVELSESQLGQVTGGGKHIGDVKY